MILLLLLVLGLVSVNMTSAETCTPVGDACTYTGSGTEPTTKVGGAPLDNLKQIVLTPKLNGVTQAPIAIPATKPQGGGAFSKQLTISTPACAITSLSMDAQAENTLGAKSAAITAAKSKDRTLDPTCAPSTGAFTLD